MFLKKKSKEIEEESDNDIFDEDEPRGSSADKDEGEDEDQPRGSSADEPRGSSADENEEDEAEGEEDPDEVPQQQSKRIAVKQELLSAEDNSEDVETDDLFEPEGELAIDVYQTDNNIVIQSAIAGVKSDEIDISVEDDIVTIRGVRKNPEQNDEKQYFHEECFWGPFSRQVFLPEEIDTQNVEASFKNGILTLRLPRIAGEKAKKVKLQKK